MIKRLRDESGYSMVEVLAAIIILSLAILPMVSMFDAGLRAAVLGGNYDKARALANSNLEEAKSKGFAEIEQSYLQPDSSNDSCLSPDEEGLLDCKIEARYLDSDLGDPRTSPGSSWMKIEVTVYWDGGNNSYSTSGLITRRSL